MATTKGRETIGNTGVLLKSGSNIGGGVLLLIIGVFVLIFEIFMLKMLMDAEFVTVNKTMFLALDQEFISYMVLMILITIPFFIVFGSMFVYMGVKSNIARYTQGERKSLWIVHGSSDLDMYAEIEVENYCPHCDANLGGSRSRYCPECGEDVNEE